MPKVVTGATLQEFVQSGKSEEIKATPRTKPVAVKDAPAPKVEEAPKKEAMPESQEDFGLEGDETELVSKSEKITKIVSKKHKAMMEAREAATESERFAENQYNRARLAEERADRLARENEGLKVKPAKAAEPENKRPDHTDKKYQDESGQFKAFVYAEDLAKWSADQAIQDDRARQKKEREEVARADIEAKAAERLTEARKRYPDFEAKVNNSDLQVHNAVLEYMVKRETIADISYYLATHPEFIERINKLGPLEAVAEVRELELSFKKPAKVEDTEADDLVGAKGVPAPIRPLTGTASMPSVIQTDPSKMSFKELRAYERQRGKAYRR